MPTKTVIPKPRIKVEEVKEEPAESVPSQEAPPSEPPKISSFSQLDSTTMKDSTTPTAPKKSILEAEPDEETTPVKEESSQPSVSQNNVSSDNDQSTVDKTQTSSEDIKEWLKEVRPDTTKENVKSGGPEFKVVLLIILILLLVGAVVGGVLYYRKGVTNLPAQPVVQETPKPTEAQLSVTPTQTPNATDLKTLSLNILNGSGKVGEASKAKDLLLKAGFSSDKVKTGNADNYNYKETVVSLKKDLDNSVFTAISDSLKDSYVVKKGDDLENSSSYDITITVGSETP